MHLKTLPVKRWPLYSDFNVLIKTRKLSAQILFGTIDNGFQIYTAWFWPQGIETIDSYFKPPLGAVGPRGQTIFPEAMALVV